MNRTTAPLSSTIIIFPHVYAVYECYTCMQIGGRLVILVTRCACRLSPSVHLSVYLSLPLSSSALRTIPSSADSFHYVGATWPYVQASSFRTKLSGTIRETPTIQIFFNTCKWDNTTTQPLDRRFNLYLLFFSFFPVFLFSFFFPFFQNFCNHEIKS